MVPLDLSITVPTQFSAMAESLPPPDEMQLPPAPTEKGTDQSDQLIATTLASAPAPLLPPVPALPPMPVQDAAPTTVAPAADSSFEDLARTLLGMTTTDAAAQLLTSSLPSGPAPLLSAAAALPQMPVQDDAPTTVAPAAGSFFEDLARTLLGMTTTDAAAQLMGCNLASGPAPPQSTAALPASQDAAPATVALVDTSLPDWTQLLGEPAPPVAPADSQELLPKTDTALQDVGALGRLQECELPEEVSFEVFFATSNQAGLGSSTAAAPPNLTAAGSSSPHISPATAPEEIKYVVTGNESVLKPSPPTPSRCTPAPEFIRDPSTGFWRPVGTGWTSVAFEREASSTAQKKTKGRKGSKKGKRSRASDDLATQSELEDDKPRTEVTHKKRRTVRPSTSASGSKSVHDSTTSSATLVAQPTPTAPKPSASFTPDIPTVDLTTPSPANALDALAAPLSASFAWDDFVQLGMSEPSTTTGDFGAEAGTTAPELDISSLFSDIWDTPAFFNPEA